jgi:hypothetical protein
MLWSPLVPRRYDTVHLTNNMRDLVALQSNDVGSAETYLLAASRSKGLANEALVKYLASTKADAPRTYP